jgi:pilus assembly protein CpaF
VAVSRPDAVLVERVRAGLASRGAVVDAAQVAAVLREQGHVVGDATVFALVDTLDRESAGAGPLEVLLREPGVTDVLVNGPGAVYVDRGGGLEPASVTFADDAQVRRLAQRLAATGGRRLDEASPFVDVRLRDGCRLHAALAPVAHPGTLLSLRVPARRVFTMAELVAAGALSPSAAGVLAGLVSSRTAFLVTGGTGTGKTTVLGALLSLVPAAERIVVVEDSAELRPDHPHVVALEARPPNVEGAGGIDLRDLVRQALRMRPDRLVVGEVRGAEVPRSSVTHAAGGVEAAAATAASYTVSKTIDRFAVGGDGAPMCKDSNSYSVRRSAIGSSLPAGPEAVHRVCRVVLRESRLSCVAVRFG